MIQFNCSCGARFEIADKHAGKRVRCRSCGQLVNVPEPEPSAELFISDPAEPEPEPAPTAPSVRESASWIPLALAAIGCIAVAGGGWWMLSQPDKPPVAVTMTDPAIEKYAAALTIFVEELRGAATAVERESSVLIAVAREKVDRAYVPLDTPPSRKYIYIRDFAEVMRKGVGDYAYMQSLQDELFPGKSQKEATAESAKLLREGADLLEKYVGDLR